MKPNLFLILILTLLFSTSGFSTIILSYQADGIPSSDTSTDMGQQFVMGGTSYQLSSVTVPVNSGWAYGTNGYLGTNYFSIGLFEDNAGHLGNLITKLTYDSFVNSIPEIGNYQQLLTGSYGSYQNISDVTFTAPNTLLNANTAYWIAPSTSSRNQGWIQLSPFSTLGDASFGLWEVNGNYYSGRAFGLTIAGTTAVPEPSTYALFGLGALALIVAYRRKVAQSLMKNKLHAFVVAAGLTSFLGNARAQNYIFTTFDNPNQNYYGTSITGVSESAIIGNYRDSSNNPVSFVYTNGTFNKISYPGSRETTVVGISGDIVVGQYDTLNEWSSFIYSNGVYSNFFITNAGITGISGSIIYGWLGTDGFTYNNGSLSLISVNNNSNVFQTEVMGVSRDTIVGVTGSNGNDDGQESFIYKNGIFSPLYFPDSVPTQTFITGISGDTIVGFYMDSTIYATHGFLYKDGSFHTIDYPTIGYPHNNPSFAYTSINGISGTTIYGEYASTNGTHGFIATEAVPEPSTYAMLGIGLVILLVIRRRRLC